MSHITSFDEQIKLLLGNIEYTGTNWCPTWTCLSKRERELLNSPVDHVHCVVCVDAWDCAGFLGNGTYYSGNKMICHQTSPNDLKRTRDLLWSCFETDITFSDGYVGFYQSRYNFIRTVCHVHLNLATQGDTCLVNKNWFLMWTHIAKHGWLILGRLDLKARKLQYVLFP